MVAPRGRAGLPLLLFLLLLPDGLEAQGREWAPADRAVIGELGRINALASSRDRVYVVSPAGILEFDPQSRRWNGPWQPPGDGLLAGVTGALADPLDGSLWMVLPSGWIRFDPGIQSWEDGTVPGRVTDAALDALLPASGLFLRTSGGWYVAQRGGFATSSAAPQRPVRITTAEQVLRTVPAIQASAAALRVEGRLRDVRLTAAARADGFLGLGWFLGTDGVGLLYYADGAGLPERFPLGLPAARVEALFPGNGGVWAVTPRTARADPALTFVASDLGQFRSFQGPTARGLPFTEARRMVGRGSELWLATGNGLVRINPRDEDARVFDEARGLPDARVLDLAQRRGRIAVGTLHGVARWDDSTGLRTLAPEFTGAAAAVELSGDTVWVGTDRGLFAALPEQPDLLQPEALQDGLSLQAPVVDLAWRSDTLVALTRDRLLWRDPGTGRYSAGPLLGAGLGQLHTVVNGAGGLYVAGERGVGFATLATPLRRALATPGDLPGRVYDLAVDDDYLWVATEAGLVRFRRDLVGR
ncbi:MAG: hypothetical protein IPO73_18450 [Gemmatimonadetes bacterium]|nr:hypothetical protein [Gemmatimonadota bacterium]